MENKIDEMHIRRNLELLSFPRLSGTEYEKKAFNLVKEKIENFGLTPEIQTFQFSTFFSRVYPKIAFPLLFWVFFTLYLNLNSSFLISNLILVLLIYLPFYIITRKPENIHIGKVLKSQNLYVKLDHKTKSVNNNEQEIDNRDILFIAHLDSKGQTITARLRALTMFLLIVSIISISIILILRTILSTQVYLLLSYIGALPMIGLFIGCIIFTFNRTNNKSKGVVDNASGVSCVLELLQYFSAIQNKINNLNLWFVFMGAEESGTMGVRYFHRILKNVNLKTSIVKNFESLGKSVIIFASRSNPKNNPIYYNYVATKAKDYGFRVIINPFTAGVHTDGIYLLKKKYNTFEFGSSEVGKFMHSDKDSLENVDTALMSKLCEFIIDLVKFWE
jgi:hypothetical protein